MKKFIAFFVLGICAVTASAQMMTSRTYSKQASPTTWYVRAGMSLNNLAGIEDGELGTKVGFDANVGFNKAIGKSGAYWGMELGIGQRGYAFGDEGSAYSWNLKYSPVTFGYKYSLTDNIKLDGHLGAYASYDFSKSAKYDGDKLDADNYFANDIDAGLQVGIGAWYGRFNLDFSYQRGFVAMYDNGSDDGCSSSFVIRVGYAF